jgi:uncharacterized protein (DUF697 family)
MEVDMNQWWTERTEGENYNLPSHPDLPDYESPAAESNGGWLGGLTSLREIWQWDQVAAEVRQEGQARIGVLGLPGSGKSVLFERLRGWVASWPQNQQPEVDELQIEAYGAFVLADLPIGGPHYPLAADEILLTVGDPHLFLYLVAAPNGVQEADYRWITLLRATGRPLVVALNQCDLLEDWETAVATARHRLGMPVIPISAMTGMNVETRLLPALVDAAPKTAISLGREIKALRRLTAWRVIRQSALMAGMMSAQPIPFLDLPFQAMLHVGVVMRVGAIYGHAPGGGREAVSTVVGYLGLNYLAQSAAKVVPILGWAISGVLGAGATLLIGEVAVRYYEAGAELPFSTYWRAGRERWGRMAVLGREWRASRRQRRQQLPLEEEIIPVAEEG